MLKSQPKQLDSTLDSANNNHFNPSHHDSLDIFYKSKVLHNDDQILSFFWRATWILDIFSQRTRALLKSWDNWYFSPNSLYSVAGLDFLHPPPRQAHTNGISHCVDDHIHNVSSQLHPSFGFSPSLAGQNFLPNLPRVSFIFNNLLWIPSQYTLLLSSNHNFDDKA